MGVIKGDTRSLDNGSHDSCRVRILGVGVPKIPSVIPRNAEHAGSIPCSNFL